MRICYITFASQTAALRFKKMAQENGIFISVLQAPKEISYGGCAYAVRCDYNTGARLISLSHGYDICYKRFLEEKVDIYGRKKYVEM